MDPEGLRNLAAGLTVAIGGLGPALGVGLIGAQAMRSLGRNPEASGLIVSNMILAIAFAEAIAIYSLLMGLVIRFVV